MRAISICGAALLLVSLAVPAFALMTAAFVSKVCGWREPRLDVAAVPSRRWVTVGQSLLGGLLVLIALAVPLAAERAEELGPRLPWVFAGVFLAAGGATIWFALRGRLLPAALAPAAGLAITYLIVAAAVYPLF